MTTIVIIDDMMPNALLLKSQIKQLPECVIELFTNPELALAWCASHDPDLILVDYMMPEMSGSEFVTKFRTHQHLQDTPIVVVTAAEDKTSLYECLSAGANDFLRKPVDNFELLARAKNMLELRRRQVELQKINKELYVLATTDGLTGVSNRRHFFAMAAQLEHMSNRNGASISVAALDLDKFKLVNDTFGHEMGDNVLRRFAEIIKGVVRASDIVGRIGGEEFAIVMPDTEGSSAAEAAERLRVRVETNDSMGNTVPFTVSIGIAERLNKTDESLIKTLARADQALYRAKAGGRNQVYVASSTSVESLTATG